MRGIPVLNYVKLTLPADVREWRRRGKLIACLMVKLRFRLGRVTEKPLAHHVTLENGSDLHVNERQKIRQYRGRSTGE